MRRVISLFLSVLILVTIVGCGSNKYNSNNKESNDKVVSRIVWDEHYPYIEYKGEPFLFYGTQIRTDNILSSWNKDMSFIDECFAHAKEDGFNTIAIPIKWYQIESIEDQFDFSLMDIYYNAIYKYDLKVNWLWFGTNVCGTGACAPPYMLKDDEKYPKRATPSGNNDYFDISVEATRKREENAITKFMEYITKRDTEKRCVMIQVNNEVNHGGPFFDPSDSLWYTSEEDYFKYAWVGGQQYATIDHLSNLGDIIHNSDYNCVTRVNVMNDAYTVGRDVVQVMLDSSGIDIVGMDDYSTDWSVLKNSLYPAEDNLFHYAENGCIYDNSYTAANMFELGCGYISYTYLDGGSTVTTRTFYDPTVDPSNPWTPNPKWPDAIEKVRAFNKMINKAEKEIAKASYSGCLAVFNGDHFLKNINQTKTFDGTDITFTCPADSLGMVAWISEKEFLLFSNGDSTTFTFSGSEKVSDATIGMYKNDKWISTNKAAYDGNTISPKAYQVIKVTID